MKLYVIRHGQTEKNRNHIIADIEEDINETGIKQAIITGKELKKKDIDLIICSPSKRTKHTLKLLNLDSDIEVKYDDRLIERDMGIYENSKFDDLDWNLFWNYYDIASDGASWVIRGSTQSVCCVLCSVTLTCDI